MIAPCWADDGTTMLGVTARKQRCAHRAALLWHVDVSADGLGGDRGGGPVRSGWVGLVRLVRLVRSGSRPRYVRITCALGVRYVRVTEAALALRVGFPFLHQSARVIEPVVDFQPVL